MTPPKWRAPRRRVLQGLGIALERHEQTLGIRIGRQSKTESSPVCCGPGRQTAPIGGTGVSESAHAVRRRNKMKPWLRRQWLKPSRPETRQTLEYRCMRLPASKQPRHKQRLRTESSVRRFGLRQVQTRRIGAIVKNVRGQQPGHRHKDHGEELKDANRATTDITVLFMMALWYHVLRESNKPADSMANVVIDSLIHRNITANTRKRREPGTA